MERVYLLLGTNVGDKKHNLSEAIVHIEKLLPSSSSKIEKSSIYESEPWGFESDESFLNQAVSFETELEPEELLVLCKLVEKNMGREVEGEEYDNEGKRIYHSRIIDVDILLFGDRKVNLPNLTIPHKELYNRDFALIPLKELKKY